MRRSDHNAIVQDLRDRVRYLERQNADLLNRLMYVSGATWTPPPPGEEIAEQPLPQYSFTPEQQMDADEAEAFGEMLG